MARSNTGSASNRFTNASAPVTAAPATLACWFKPANLTACNNLLFVTNSTFNNYFGLEFDGANLNGQGDDVVLADTTNSTSTFGVSGTGGTAGSWMHCAAVFTSATSRQAFMNGVGGTVNTTSKTPTSLTVTHVGSLSTFSPLNGSMCEAAIWNVALSADEILSLSKGVCPLLIRPQKLLRYWPLWGNGTEASRFLTNSTLTLVGTMAKAEHAPIFMPRMPLLGIEVAGAGSQSITGALFDDADVFFTSVTTVGSVTITGGLFTDTDTFFGSTVTTGSVSINGALFSDTDTFFAATFTTGAVTINGNLFTDADTFFAAAVTVGAVTITADLFTDTDTFFTNVVTQSGANQNITGALFTDSDTFFVSATTTGSVSINGALFTDSDTFFTASLTVSAFTIVASLFTDVDSFFASSLTTGSVTVNGNLFSDPDVFFNGALSDGTGTGTGTSKFWFHENGFFGGP